MQSCWKWKNSQHNRFGENKLTADAAGSENEGEQQVDGEILLGRVVNEKALLEAYQRSRDINNSTTSEIFMTVAKQDQQDNNGLDKKN